MKMSHDHPLVPSDDPEEQICWSAYQALDAGQPGICLKALRELKHAKTPLIRSLRNVARGLSAEKRGDAAAVTQGFDAADRIGLPLGALLQHSARHFMQRQDKERSYRYYSLLDTLRPGAFLEYWRTLAPADACRLAPWVVQHDPDTVHGLLAEYLNGAALALVCRWLFPSRTSAASDVDGVQAMQQAYAALDQGRATDALRHLEHTQIQADPVAQSICHTARALLALQAGDPVSAGGYFDAAHAIGIPLPVVLRECGRYYQRQPNQSARAFECFSVLGHLDPAASLSYWRSFAQPARLRYAPLVLAHLLHAPMPPVYEIQMIKRNMIEHWGEFTTSILFAETLYHRRAWHIRQLTLGGLQAYARQHALSYTEFATPRDVVIHAPDIFRGPRYRNIHGRSRSFFFCVLPDVTVVAKSNLLFTQYEALLDHQGDELERIPYNADINPSVISFTQHHVSVLECAEAQSTVDEAFTLVGNHTYNYGHWIVEFMFQVWACIRQPGFERLPLIIDAQMPPQHRQLLEFFLGADHPMIVLQAGESLRVRQLWACSKVSYWPGGESFPLVHHDDYQIADMAELASIIESFGDKLDSLDTTGCPQKLYLTRDAKKSRPFVNRRAVEDFFKEQGFSVFDFGHTPILEQLRYLRAARTVIVEAGSSLYGTIFCRRGACVGELPSCDPTEREWCAELFRALGHRFLLLPCTQTRDGILADISGIKDYLEQLENCRMETTIP